MDRRGNGIAGMALFLAAGVAQAAGHAQCTDCHATVTPSADDLIQPLSALCVNCHQARIDQGEHAVDIPVTNTVTGLPLQGGLMTCITCHDPHAKGLALRQPDPQLCRACHPR